MKKERNSVYNKVEIKRKGTIEENIDKLKKDLGVYLEGAEDIAFDKEKEEKFISPVKRKKKRKYREKKQRKRRKYKRKKQS